MATFIQRHFLKPGMLSHFHHSRGPKAFVCLNDASTVGILADVRVPQNLPPVVHFARSVHKSDRRCHILLLVNEKRKEINPFNYEKHFPGMPVELICQDEMNLYKVPRKELSHPFTVHQFDIVFYLETAENFSLESVLYHTHGKMYAGASGLCEGIFDFEIDISEHSDLLHLTENLMKYLHKSRVSQENKPSESETFKLF